MLRDAGELLMKNLIAVCVALFVYVPVYAQWTKVPPPAIPRGPDGKPNLSAPAPKLPDGTADLSGVWEPAETKWLRNLAADI